jgi:uncharacterized coiled-coil DUF342 family protein
MNAEAEQREKFIQEIEKRRDELNKEIDAYVDRIRKYGRSPEMKHHVDTMKKGLQDAIEALRELKGHS